MLGMLSEDIVDRGGHLRGTGAFDQIVTPSYPTVAVAIAAELEDCAVAKALFYPKYLPGQHGFFPSHG